MKIVSKEKFLRDALDPVQKQRRARKRYFEKRREIIGYTRDCRARALREKMGK